MRVAGCRVAQRWHYDCLQTHEEDVEPHGLKRDELECVTRSMAQRYGQCLRECHQRTAANPLYETPSHFCTAHRIVCFDMRKCIETVVRPTGDNSTCCTGKWVNQRSLRTRLHMRQTGTKSTTSQHSSYRFDTIDSAPRYRFRMMMFCQHCRSSYISISDSINE